MEALYYLTISIDINFFLVSIILLFLKRGNIKSNRILALLLLSIVYLNEVLSFYTFKNILIQYPHLIRTHIPILFIIPPLFYLYIKSLFENKFNFKIKFIYNFLPSIISILYFMPFYLKSSEYKINWLLHAKYEYHYFLGLIFYIQFIVYIILVFIDLKNYSTNIKSVLGLPDEIQKWIKEFIYIVIGLLVFTIIPVFISFKIESLLLIPVFSSIVYFFIIFKVFFQPEVFDNLQILHQVVEDKKKYANSNLNNEDINNIYSRVVSYFETNQSFLNSELSLPILSEEINVPTHQLSQAINQKLNQNFNDFVNYYRIQEAKKRLLDTKYDNITIEAIAKSVGFNSKTTFNNSFKKFLQTSPSLYKKTYQEQQRK